MPARTRHRHPPYDRLLDAETWDFIDRSCAHYPENASELAIVEQRRVYDELCNAFDAGRPADVSVVDERIDEPQARVTVRRYSSEDGAPAARVLYLHGGGFVVGGLDSHDSICAEICSRTGFETIAVDYRLAPEHPHPAQFEDALAASRRFAGMSDRPLILCGDSAGGNLAAAVAWVTRSDEVKPCGQVLIYPALGGNVTAGSYVTHAGAPLLTTADMMAYDRLRSGGLSPGDDPRFAPLAAKDMRGLPPTLVFTAECDPLASDGPAYCARIREAGGKARCVEEKGLVHGYLRARHSVTRARDSFTRIVEGIAALGAGTWPD